MNNNPDNLQEGQRCILDKDYHNKSEVFIWELTPNEMFATIYSAVETGDMWNVMTNRLSKLK